MVRSGCKTEGKGKIILETEAGAESYGKSAAGESEAEAADYQRMPHNIVCQATHQRKNEEKTDPEECLKKQYALQ